MQSPIILRNCRRVSHIVPAACGSDSSTSECVPQPIVLRDTGDLVSWRAPLHRAAGRVEYSAVSSFLSPQAFPHTLYPRTGARVRSLGGGPPLTLVSASGASRRAGPLRLRLAIAGFHERLRASCAWFLFFPRSVGLGPTASKASGAFTIVASMLCHDQAMPSISSYSASPLRHILMKMPPRFHSKKYLCTELALPYSFGNAFHWQPVRSTYTIASNTRRGSIGFRPPPGRRLYRTPFGRLTFGIRGATRSHNASDTVHDLSVLMRSSITQVVFNGNIYLRISSK